MSFGSRLRSLRVANDMTQSELAEKICLSKANVSKYETDQVEPNIETLTLLASLFDVSTDYLLAYTDDKRGMLPRASLFDLESLPDDETRYLCEFSVRGPEADIQALEDYISTNFKFAPGSEAQNKKPTTQEEGQPVSVEDLKIVRRFNSLSPESKARALGYLDSLEGQENL